MAKTTAEKLAEAVEARKMVTGKLMEANRELSQFKSENGLLRQNLVGARQLMANLLKSCKVCGKNKITIDWNSKVYALTCDNVTCLQYRVPIDTIEKESVNWLLNPKEEIGGIDAHL